MAQWGLLFVYAFIKRWTGFVFKNMAGHLEDNLKAHLKMHSGEKTNATNVIMYPLCLLNLCFYRKKESVVFKDMTGHLEDASVFMAHIKVYAKVKHLFIDIALSKTIFELLLEIDVRLSGRLCSQNWINFRLFIA